MRLITAPIVVSLTFLLMAYPPTAAGEQTARERLQAIAGMMGARHGPDKRDEQRDDRRRWSPEPGEGAASRAAAARAERRYGGRALAVVRFRDGHKVRLLLDGGRVTTVFIRD